MNRNNSFVGAYVDNDGKRSYLWWTLKIMRFNLRTYVLGHNVAPITFTIYFKDNYSFLKLLFPFSLLRIWECKGKEKAKGKVSVLCGNCNSQFKYKPMGSKYFWYLDTCFNVVTLHSARAPEFFRSFKTYSSWLWRGLANTPISREFHAC